MANNLQEEKELKMETTNMHVFSRLPLAAPGKITLGALLGGAVSTGVLALLIGLPDNIALLIVTGCLLVCAGLVVTGLRWIPLLATLLSVVLLFQISKVPFVNYHLTHPQTGGFAAFVFDVLIIAFLVGTIVASIDTTVQNYRQRQRQLPRWLASTLFVMAGIVIGAVLIGAISQPAQPAAATSVATSGEAAVHMGPNSFLQSSVTVSKGSKLLLVDDGTFFHILANGSWKNGAPQPASEPGAPAVNNIQVTGSSIEIGPFTAAGTYHIYCTVHPGMNLTIVVQ